MLVYLQAVGTEEDKCKFELLYQHYNKLMFMVAKDILHNDQDAENAVHLAFESIVQHMEKVDEPISRRTQGFVAVITRRKAIDMYRYKQRRPAASLRETFVGDTFELPAAGALATAMAKLPPRYRDFLLLKYDSGYSNKELVSILGIGYAGIHSLDTRSKNRLRELLLEEEEVRV